MKITIWQQFSSNHSASYTIVGEFTTQEEARNAAEKITTIIQQIAAWSDQNHDKLWGENWTPNPVEEQIAKTHNIDWQQPVDWLRPYSNTHFRTVAQRTLDENVVTCDKLVLIDVPGAQTWQTGHHFTSLLDAMGAKTYQEIAYGYDLNDEMVFADFNYELECHAPTVDIAEDIHRQLQRQLDNKDEFRPPFHPIPWIFYHYRYTQLTNNMPHEQFRDAEQIWIQEEAWTTYLDENPQLREDRERLIEEAKQFKKQDEALSEVIWWLRYNTNLRKGIATRTGRVINLKSDTRGGVAFILIPALMLWMQLLGCAVSCQLTQGTITRGKV